MIGATRQAQVDLAPVLAGAARRNLGRARSVADRLDLHRAQKPATAGVGTG